MGKQRNLLIIGARAESIGDLVAYYARKEGDWEVSSAGIDPEENFHLDLRDPLTDPCDGDIQELIYDRPWYSVVCTAGINESGRLDNESAVPTLVKTYRSFNVNALGPLAILEAWLRYWRLNEGATQAEDGVPNVNHHFAFISSNSAHVPRSNSVPYCTTKAALSMAVRCVARDLGSTNPRISVYGYEPGWVEGTPMSTAVRERLPMRAGITRAPGARTLTKHDLAKMIVTNLELGHALNGSMIRVDGGEA